MTGSLNPVRLDHRGERRPDDAVRMGHRLLQGLRKIDLPGRLGAATPRPVVQLGVAAALLLIVMILRRTIDIMAPGTVPFALLFPSVLVATVMAGWLCGAIVMTVGGALTWLVVMRPPPGVTHSLAELVSIGLYLICAAAIVAFAEAYRKTAQAMLSGQAALSESEARMELATQAADMGVWEYRPPTEELIYSEEAKAICGFPPGEPVTLEMARSIVHREDLPRTTRQRQRAFDPAIRDTSPYEYRIITPAGEERWLVNNARAVFETVGGETMVTRYVGALRDVTAAKRAEAERDTGVARLGLAIDAGRMAVWQVDRHGMAHSPELNRIMGLAADARPTVEEINALYLPGEYERVDGMVQAALGRGERHVEAEWRIRRPSGEVRWILVRAEIQLNREGRPRRALGVMMDVTERRESEERLKLLAREVDHRANNLLAVVQGTIQLSNAADVDALKAVLVGRISALGRAHQLLAEARWEGADLRRLVEEELLAFSLGEVARVSIRGPDVALAPAAAQALAMALHELATNAAKYGALSTPAGQVAVSWTREGEGPLVLQWTETGGPMVAKPSRRGLGTTMLARALAGPLNGVSRLDWRPEGLVCELELPGEALETAGA